MRIGILFLIYVFIHTSFVSAQVLNIYNGNINSDTHWEAATINVHTNVSVKQGAILTIGAGSTVIFKDRYELSIMGSLTALGNAANPIVFKPENTSTGWEGVNLKPKNNNTDTIKFIHCIFEYGKTQNNDGGVINIQDDSKVLIDFCHFKNNTAKETGGAISAKKSHIAIKNSHFNDNYAPDDGGSIFFEDMYTFYIENCHFQNNKAGEKGGAIYIDEAQEGEIVGSLITDNEAQEGGGLMVSDVDDIEIKHTHFNHNYAFEDGGSIFFEDMNSFYIVNCRFQNNKAGKKGGAIYVDEAEEGKVVGTLITNNEAQDGGGLAVNDVDNFNIINSTITQNKASNTNSEGIRVTSSGVNVINSIVWPNSNSGILTQDVSYSIIWQMSNAARSIYDTDPEFLQPASANGNSNDALNADYAVAYSSVAYNGGSPNTSGLSLPGNDIAGNPRFTGERIDIGAYEKLAPAPFELHPVSDTDLCTDEALILVSTSKGSSYQWKRNGVVLPINNDTLIIPSVSEADEGTYTCTIINGIVSFESLPLDVVVNPIPVAELDDVSNCEGDEVIVNPGLDPAYSYVWSTGSSDNQITISAAGNYWLEVTNEHDCSTVETFSLTTEQKPTVSLPDDYTVCTDQQIINIPSNAQNYTDIFWETTGSGELVVNLDKKEITYTFSSEELETLSSIIFYVSANGDLCNAAKDTLTVTIAEATQINIADTTFCEDETLTIEPLVESNISLAWSTGENSASINISTPGEYWVRATNENNCVSVDTFTVNAETKPIVNLPSDAAFCITGAPLEIAANASGYHNLIWETNGNGSLQALNDTKKALYQFTSGELQNLTPVTVYALATSTKCADAKDSITITPVASPDISIADTIICEGNALTVDPSAGPDYSYSWSTGENTPAISVSSSGTYWVRVENSNNCATTDTFLVENTAAPRLSLEEDYVICSSDSTINIIPRLAVNYSTIQWTSNGEGILESFDNGNEINYSFSLEELLNSNPLELIATAISPACPPAKDTLILQRQPAPIISAPLELDVCFTDQAIQMDVAINEGYSLNFESSEEGEISYVDSVLSFIPGILDTGLDAISMLIVTQQDPVCPSVTHKITINNAKPKAAFTVPDGCTKQEVNFLNTVYPTIGNKHFRWDFGDGNTSEEFNPTHIYADSGKFNVQMIACSTNDNACCDTIDHDINITILPEPDFEAAYDCENIYLTYKGTESEAFRYRWRLSNGMVSEEKDPVFENNNTTGLTLTVRNEDCTAEAEYTIDPFIIPEAQFTTNVRDAGVNQQVNFINQSKNAAEYEWIFEEGKRSTAENPAYTFTSTGIKEIKLAVISEDGCEDTYTKVLDISAGLASPTAFSPNGDYVNDTYMIMGGPFESFEMIIFNKWGTRMFYTRNPNEGWDGTFNNETQPVGEYIFQVRATTISGATFAKTGNFVLIK